MNLDRSHSLLRPDLSLLRWKEQYLHSTISGTKCGIVHSQALQLEWYYADVSKRSHARGCFWASRDYLENSRMEVVIQGIQPVSRRLLQIHSELSSNTSYLRAGREN